MNSIKEDQDIQVRDNKFNESNNIQQQNSHSEHSQTTHLSQEKIVKQQRNSFSQSSDILDNQNRTNIQLEGLRTDNPYFSINTEDKNVENPENSNYVQKLNFTETKFQNDISTQHQVCPIQKFQQCTDSQTNISFFNIQASPSDIDQNLKGNLQNHYTFTNMNTSQIQNYINFEEDKKEKFVQDDNDFTQDDNDLTQDDNDLTQDDNDLTQDDQGNLFALNENSQCRNNHYDENMSDLSLFPNEIGNLTAPSQSIPTVTSNIFTPQNAPSNQVKKNNKDVSFRMKKKSSKDTSIFFEPRISDDKIESQGQINTEDHNQDCFQPAQCNTNPQRRNTANIVPTKALDKFMVSKKTANFSDPQDTSNITFFGKNEPVKVIKNQGKGFNRQGTAIINSIKNKKRIKSQQTANFTTDPQDTSNITFFGENEPVTNVENQDKGPNKQNTPHSGPNNMKKGTKFQHTADVTDPQNTSNITFFGEKQTDTNLENQDKGLNKKNTPDSSPSKIKKGLKFQQVDDNTDAQNTSEITFFGENKPEKNVKPSDRSPKKSPTPGVKQIHSKREIKTQQTANFPDVQNVSNITDSVESEPVTTVKYQRRGFSRQGTAVLSPSIMKKEIKSQQTANFYEPKKTSNMNNVMLENIGNSGESEPVTTVKSQRKGYGKDTAVSSSKKDQKGIKTQQTANFPDVQNVSNITDSVESEPVTTVKSQRRGFSRQGTAVLSPRHYKKGIKSQKTAVFCEAVDDLNQTFQVINNEVEIGGFESHLQNFADSSFNFENMNLPNSNKESLTTFKEEFILNNNITQTYKVGNQDTKNQEIILGKNNDHKEFSMGSSKSYLTASKLVNSGGGISYIHFESKSMTEAFDVYQNNTEHLIKTLAEFIKKIYLDKNLSAISKKSSKCSIFDEKNRLEFDADSKYNTNEKSHKFISSKMKKKSKSITNLKTSKNEQFKKMQSILLPRDNNMNDLRTKMISDSFKRKHHLIINPHKLDPTLDFNTNETFFSEEKKQNMNPIVKSTFDTQIGTKKSNSKNSKGNITIKNELDNNMNYDTPVDSIRNLSHIQDSTKIINEVSNNSTIEEIAKDLINNNDEIDPVIIPADTNSEYGTKSLENKTSILPSNTCQENIQKNKESLKSKKIDKNVTNIRRNSVGVQNILLRKNTLTSGPETYLQDRNFKDIQFNVEKIEEEDSPDYLLGSSLHLDEEKKETRDVKAIRKSSMGIRSIMRLNSIVPISEVECEFNKLKDISRDDVSEESYDSLDDSNEKPDEEKKEIKEVEIIKKSSAGIQRVMRLNSTVPGPHIQKEFDKLKDIYNDELIEEEEDSKEELPDSLKGFSDNSYENEKTASPTAKQLRNNQIDIRKEQRKNSQVMNSDDQFIKDHNYKNICDNVELIEEEDSNQSNDENDINLTKEERLAKLKMNRISIKNQQKKASIVMNNYDEFFEHRDYKNMCTEVELIKEEDSDQSHSMRDISNIDQNTKEATKLSLDQKQSKNPQKNEFKLRNISLQGSGIHQNRRLSSSFDNKNCTQNLNEDKVEKHVLDEFLTTRSKKGSTYSEEVTIHRDKKLFNSYLWSYLNPNGEGYNFVKKFKIKKNKFDTTIISGEFNAPDLCHSISPILVQTKNSLINPVPLNSQNLKSVDFNYKTSYQIYLESEKSFPIYDFRRSQSKSNNPRPTSTIYSKSNENNKKRRTETYGFNSRYTNMLQNRKDSEKTPTDTITKKRSNTVGNNSSVNKVIHSTNKIKRKIRNNSNNIQKNENIFKVSNNSFTDKTNQCNKIFTDKINQSNRIAKSDGFKSKNIKLKNEKVLKIIEAPKKNGNASASTNYHIYAQRQEQRIDNFSLIQNGYDRNIQKKYSLK